MTQTSATLTEAPVQRRPQRLLFSLFVLNAVLLASYASFIVIFVPNQVQSIDPVHKVGNLAIVMTAASVVVIFVQPLVGAFSDRTRSRMGRRAPWMLMGAAGGALFMLLMAGTMSLLWITVFWVLMQLSLNALNAPITAVVADRIPRDRRGVASSLLAMGALVGMGAGVLGAGVFAESIGVGYSVFAGAVLIASFGFVLLNRDFSSLGLQVSKVSWRQFVRGFWVSPREHPDFAWAFAARFLMILAYQGLQTYLLYILRDLVGLGINESNSLAGLLTVAQLLAALLSTYVSGRLSDRLGRRKIFVIVASIIMAGALAIPLVFPTVGGMFALAALFGLGYGVYLSVDLALMTQVLPAEESSAGKDLGILNVATTLPQALTPLVAWLLISWTGGYSSIFVAGIGFAIFGALAVIPIKSVK